MNARVKIGLLILVHLTGGIVLGWLSHTGDWPHPAAVSLVGLIFAEGSLIGTWGALGISYKGIRAGVVVATTAYLCFIYGINANVDGLNEIVIVSLLFVSPVVGTLLSLAAIKWWRKLLVIQAGYTESKVEGIHFTLLHLFGFTSAVAVVLSIGRVMRGYTGEDWNGNVIFFAVLGVCVVGVQLGILWATLCAGRPAIRLAFVFPIALAVGAIPPYCFLDINRDQAYVAWPGMFGFQVAVAAGSLLVVRSNGWRIVKRHVASDDPPDQREPTTTP